MTVATKRLLTRNEAAEELGVSLSHFKRHIQPHLPCVYIGSLRQYRPSDLDRWIDRNVSEGERASSS